MPAYTRMRTAITFKWYLTALSRLSICGDHAPSRRAVVVPPINTAVLRLILCPSTRHMLSVTILNLQDSPPVQQTYLTTRISLLLLVPVPTDPPHKDYESCCRMIHRDLISVLVFCSFNPLLSSPLLVVLSLQLVILYCPCLSMTLPLHNSSAPLCIS